MPRLPPVPISPQARLLSKLRRALTYSTLTLAQSHSSSSATSCAMPVKVPWPISVRAKRMTQLSSGRTATQTLSSVAGAPACAAASPRLIVQPSARPPEASAESRRKRRRARLVMVRVASFFMVVPYRRGVASKSA